MANRVHIITKREGATLSRNLLSVLIVSVLSIFAAYVFLIQLYANQFWVSVPFHSAIEAIGGFIALMIAAILLQIESNNEIKTVHIWSASALIGMGILDIFHAFMLPGEAFVWLHSTATLTGGLLFSMVWLHNRFWKVKSLYFLPKLITILSIGLGTLFFSLPNYLVPMLDGENFTTTAEILNISGGLLFLAGSTYFIKMFRANKELDDIIFAGLCLLFGLAGLVFDFSKLWDLTWWLLHFIRVIAYGLALYFIFNNYWRISTSLNTETDERKQLQEQFYSIINNSPTIIFQKDAEGKYVLINQALETFSGITNGELRGKTDYDIFPKKIADVFVESDKKVTILGTSIQGEAIVPMGEKVHTFSVVKFPLFNSMGKIYGICGIYTDITAQKILQQQLRQSQKLESLGKLTGGIAHDYNNMLGVILGYSDILQKLLADQPKLANYVHQIHRAGRRGATLSQKLLSFSRSESTVGKELDINTVLQEQLDMLQKTLTVRIKLTYELCDNIWYVWLDNNDLEDAVLNMGINAMHAMKGKKEGASLIISTANRSISQQDALTFHLKSGDYVELSITDTGTGMEKSIQDNIFDPFFSTKGEKGSGLGLSQVYGFINRAEGAIVVDSEPGQGSCFRLYFPRYLSKESVDKNDTDYDDSNLDGNETILLVDDEEALLDLLSDTLESKGYNVISTTTPEDVLDILSKEAVDLLISDIIMPNIDGFKLANQVQEKFPDVKIQLVSGHSGGFHETVNDQSLYKSMLKKPVESKILMERVRFILDE